MRAVWRAARFAVRRRKLQTFIIGMVLLVSTATVVLALGLLVTVDGPYDRAFTQVRGAHLTVVYDATKAEADQAKATGTGTGVTATGGPYPTTVLTIAGERNEGGPPPNEPGGRQEEGSMEMSPFPPGPLTVVERTYRENDPVDQLELRRGRWANGPGEIVMSSVYMAHFFGFDPLGKKVEFTDGRSLTVVGIARSITGSAEGWVIPGVLGEPAGHQMLYRLAAPATPVATVAAGLPVVSSQSYLLPRAAAASDAKTLIPFLMAFGVLGLLVAVIIIGNVVSGAVVSGFRHIGVLKALGFTPAQVTCVYLIMVAIPGMAGSLAGIGIGNVLAGTVTSSLGDSLDLPATDGVSAGVDVLAFCGVLAVIVVTAMFPAVRAGRIPAAIAVSAGSATRRGRALRVQRFLAGTRLPRPLSLGLGLPFARPGRTAMTISAVALGVAAVTFATGLYNTINANYTDENRTGTFQVEVNGSSLAVADRPGTAGVAVAGIEEVAVPGHTGAVRIKAYQSQTGASGSSRYGYRLVHGNWLAGPGEVVVTAAVLKETGLRLGETMTVRTDDRTGGLRIVGVALMDGDKTVLTDWATLSGLIPGLRASLADVALTPGTSAGAYVMALEDDGIHGRVTDDRGGDSGLVIVLGLIAMLTLGVALVAGLGVFNTVVLNTQDRARDFGVLKSLGATPKQVLVVVVTSMAALGTLGGLIGVPLGVAAHGVVLPLTAEAAGIELPYGFLELFPVPSLVGFALAGVLIAVLGAIVPAGWAARIRTASALRSE